METLEMQLVSRLHELVKERQSLKSRIDALRRQIMTLEKEPLDGWTKNELDALIRERAGFQVFFAFH